MQDEINARQAFTPAGGREKRTSKTTGNGGIIK